MNDQHSEMPRSPVPEGIVDHQLLMIVIWRRRWMIAITTLISTISFIVLAIISEPVYRGTVVLMPANLDRSALGGSLGSTLGSVGGLAALAGIELPNNNAAVEEALAVLQSKQLTEAFIAQHDLMPVLFYKIWDPATGGWKVPPNKQPTPARAFKLFDKIRSIKRSEKTGLITMQIDWRNRFQAAQWANDLVASLNAEMRARAIAQADASLGYLDKELAQITDVDTRESVNRLIEGQIKQRMLADVTKEYSLRVVDAALVPDADDTVGPHRVLLLGIGLLLGVTIGITIALLMHVRSEAARRGS